MSFSKFWKEWSTFGKIRILVGFVALLVYGGIQLVLGPRMDAFDERVAKEWETRTIEVYEPEEMEGFLVEYMSEKWTEAYIITYVPENLELGIKGTETLDGTAFVPEYTYVMESCFTVWDEEPLEKDVELWFCQSKSNTYDKQHRYVKNLENPEKNKLYLTEEDGQKIVFWFDGDYTLYLKNTIGNMPLEELEAIAEGVRRIELSEVDV
ncbi:DUF4367 domain-containing protein [Chakrabartyella piscis]|uniref:DUF4367 domain-containing protein n=1 Tax=Chakrabartyella piscis TaxID=2918914 RepID=UPI002958D304|nr:DUF4367 domain-containing protein [Chakrabartyella piscis]